MEKKSFGASKEFVLDQDLEWEKVGEGVKRKIMTYDDKIMLVKVHFEAGGEGGDIAPSTAKPNLAAEPTAVLGSEAISASGSESTTVAAEAKEKAAMSTSDPVSGAEEGPRADAVSPSPDPAAIKAEPASLPEEPKAPSATQDEQQDANQPTLTLPLTLPSGGGH